MHRGFAVHPRGCLLDLRRYPNEEVFSTVGGHELETDRQSVGRLRLSRRLYNDARAAA